MLSGKRYSSWMQMLGIENVADLILRTETTKCLLPLLPGARSSLPQAQSSGSGTCVGSGADAWE